MPADLERQLATYGQWLEQKSATTLRPVPPANVEAVDQLARLVEVGATRSTRRRSALLTVAAASILVVGLVGVTVSIRRNPAPPAATSVRVDPPGPLFVLPDDPDIAVSGGHVSLVRSEPMSSSPSLGWAAVLGTPVDDGFEDLVMVTTSADFVESSDMWVAGTYGGFPTRTFNQDFTTWVVQDRGTWSVAVYTGPERLDTVHDVLDHVTVDLSGQITIDAASPRDIVDGYPLANMEPAEFTATWMATIEGADQPNLEVTTAAFPGLVIPPGGIARIEPTTISGVEAWRMIASDNPPISSSASDDETVELRFGVQWQFSPNRTVFVGGPGDINAIETFAASLTQVTPEHWATDLPGYTTECTIRKRCAELLPELATP